MELIAVLFIISIMMAFTIPEFSQDLFRDDTETSLNWLVFNTGKLKTDARQQGKNLFMCIRTDTNTIGITQDPATKNSTVIREFSLPGGITLDGVEFNGPGQEDSSEACIQFYKEGYSDPAIVHLSDDRGNFFSCIIHPFLHTADVQKGHVHFD